MNKIFVLALIFFTTLHSDYEFKGKHYIASYRKCERSRLTSIPYLLIAFEGSVLSTGATILDKNVAIFGNEGVTALFLLSESHASIHTYPEHGACFVDLFTCGDTCDWKQFDILMKFYLEPGEVSYQLIERD